MLILLAIPKSLNLKEMFYDSSVIYVINDSQCIVIVFAAIPPSAPVLVSPKHIVYYSDESLKLEAQFRGNFFEHYWRHRAFGSTTGTTLMPPDVAITNLGQTYTIAPGSSHHQKGYFEPFLLPASNTFIMPTVENTVVVDDHSKCMSSCEHLTSSYSTFSFFPYFL